MSTPSSMENSSLSHSASPWVKETGTYKLRVCRLLFIDTAEETTQRLERIRKQWGSHGPISIRVVNGAVHVGTTSFKTITSYPGWVGVSWRNDDIESKRVEDNGVDPSAAATDGVNCEDEACFSISRSPGLMLVFEVVGARENHTTYGVGMLNSTAILAEKRNYVKYPVYLFPTQVAIDSETVYAIAEVQVCSSTWDGCHEDGVTSLEYDFGSVRLSTLDFYFPSFVLNDEGSYVVTNVVAVTNTTADTALAMQLLPLEDAHTHIFVGPSGVVTARPQQRLYFTATWSVGERACMKKLHMQLVVHGPRPVSAPIIINVHNSTPQPSAAYAPYHYWLNTTCITNRHFSPLDELPLLLNLLPVFQLNVHKNKNAARKAAAHDSDRGGGAQNVVDPIIIVGALGGSGVVYPMNAVRPAPVVAPHDPVLSNLQVGSKSLTSDVPTVDISQKTCKCILRLGTIRGLPIVSEFATSVSSSFQVSITLLDQQGWKVVAGETEPQYQSASGSLQWDDELELWKWPGARCQQFLRLNLMEVRAYDGDTVPIGAGLVSLSRLNRTPPQVGFNVAFYVYETYSLYDTLHASSLLMTGASITFRELPET